MTLRSRSQFSLCASAPARARALCDLGEDTTQIQHKNKPPAQPEQTTKSESKGPIRSLSPSTVNEHPYQFSRVFTTCQEKILPFVTFFQALKNCYGVSSFIREDPFLPYVSYSCCHREIIYLIMGVLLSAMGDSPIKFLIPALWAPIGLM